MKFLYHTREDSFRNVSDQCYFICIVPFFVSVLQILLKKFLLGMPHVLKHLTFVTYFLRTCFSFPVLSKPVSLTFDIKRMYFKKDWARRIMVPCHVLHIEKKFLETLWACIQLNKIHIEVHSTSFQQIYLWIRLQSMPYVLFRLLQR